MKNARIAVRRVGFSVSTLLWLALAGCGGESVVEGGNATLLRERFSGQAAKVLGEGAAEQFKATENGFVPGAIEPGQGTWRSLSAILPHEGQQDIRFEAPGGFSIRVREVGASGVATPEERSIRYARAGGSSYWTVTGSGFEEWLHLGAEAVRDDRPVVVWEVDGGELRQADEAVDIADAEGRARIRVTAPIAYGADGREIGLRIVAADKRIELFVEANGEEVLVDPAWVNAMTMPSAHWQHAAERLADGRVIVAGGIINSPSTAVIANVDRFDPATNTWAAITPMGTSRRGFTLTRLNNGKVLAAGGNNLTQSSLSSAELYDPNTNTWAPTGAMSQTRSAHTATLLTNGKVLVAGGWSQTAELYDPGTGTWSSAGTMSEVRYVHAASRLSDGRVLVSGGGANAPTASAEIYNPATNTWSTTGSMTVAREQLNMLTLSNGKVLAIGGRGQSWQDLSTTEVYDAATGTWAASGSMVYGGTQPAVAALPNGKALGFASGAASTFDAATNIWSPTPDPLVYQHQATGTALLDGRVLIAGGSPYAGADILHAQIYDPNAVAGSAINGTSCTLGSQCQSGFCTDGVCCNAACNAGACDACSVAAGAPTNGTCAPLTGNACTDGNACTLSDTCQAGVCSGGNAVTCTASDQCHDAGTCNPATGACSNPAKPNGSVCNDSDACTSSDTCQAGVCSGGNAVTCTASDACHDAGTCDPATGACSNPAKPNGSVCNDSNACTLSDTCQSGACVGANPVVCTPPVCQVNAACDPANGSCTFAPAPNGTLCAGGTCQAGACVPMPVTLAPLAAFSAGGAHALALLEDGTVLSWGSDQDGQLGVPGSIANRTKPGVVSLPVPVLVDSSLTTIAAGGKHSLAVLADGRIAAWGNNSFGQLGNDSIAPVTEAPIVYTLPGNVRAMAVAAGENHSLIIDENLNVWAVGRNNSKQIGQLSGAFKKDLISPLAGLSDIIAIAAGGDHSYALDTAGVVRSWGANGFGQLGDGGSTLPDHLPNTVALPGFALAIASGKNHGIALLSDYTVQSWGSDSNGQLGDGGSSQNKSVPVPVPTITGAYAVAAGGNHSLVLRVTGAMNSFGQDSSGQLGNDTPMPLARHAPVTVAGGANYGLIFAAGSTFSLFSKNDGSLASAGSDASGQLGNGGPATTVPEPVPVSFTLAP